MSTTNQLINCLEQEIKWIDELNALLLEERDVLAKRQFEKLEDFAKNKQTLIDSLEESTKIRVQLLKLEANNDPKQALSAFLKGCPAAEAINIDKLSNQLAEKLITCRENNSINGQVIATNIHSRKEIVDTITNSNTKNSAVDVYTSAGNIKSSANKGQSHKA